MGPVYDRAAAVTTGQGLAPRGESPSAGRQGEGRRRGDAVRDADGPGGLAGRVAGAEVAGEPRVGAAGDLQPDAVAGDEAVRGVGQHGLDLALPRARLLPRR